VAVVIPPAAKDHGIWPAVVPRSVICWRMNTAVIDTTSVIVTG
jgi:hypothetical protein